MTGINDNFVDAIGFTIPTDGDTVLVSQPDYDNNDFTVEPGEPSPCGTAFNKTAWWTYTPAADGILVIDTAPSYATGSNDPDTQIALYTGTSIGALTAVASNDDSSPAGGYRSRFSVSVVGGVTYHLQVANFAGSLSVLNRIHYAFNATGPASVGGSRTVTGHTAHELDVTHHGAKVSGVLIVGSTVHELDTSHPATLTLVVHGGHAHETDQAIGREVPPPDLVPGEIVVEILDPLVAVAPSAVTIVVSGGQPTTTATISIDGSTVAVGTLDTNGSLSSTTVPFGPLAAGTHTLSVRQLVATGDTITGSATFTIARAPNTFPTPPPAGAPAVFVPGSIVPGTGVQRWVLQDPGGLGDYILPANPRTMTSPHYAKTLTARRTTSVDGQFHVSEAAGQPKPWQFAGYTADQNMCDQLLAYRDLPRRFYVIDHRNRAWQVVFNQVQLVPRLRQRVSVGGAADVLTDWGHDYTVLATILNQNWTVPA